MKSQLLIVVEVTLLIMLSSFGHTQPKDYQNPEIEFDTGHIRGPHHPRSSRGTANHAHHHYVPHKQEGGVAAGQGENILTHDKQLLHDKEHLKEDLGEWADLKDMSPEEMEFHYFKTHDFDNNSMLDGLEILQAISHILPMSDAEEDLTAASQSNDQQGHDTAAKTVESGDRYAAPAPLSEAKRAEMMKQREEDFNYYVDLIDKVLAEDDLNRDGYLSYFEYSVGRRREEELQRQQVAKNNKNQHGSHVG